MLHHLVDDPLTSITGWDGVCSPSSRYVATGSGSAIDVAEAHRPDPNDAHSAPPVPALTPLSLLILDVRLSPPFSQRQEISFDISSDEEGKKGNRVDAFAFDYPVSRGSA